MRNTCSIFVWVLLTGLLAACSSTPRERPAGPGLDDYQAQARDVFSTPSSEFDPPAEADGLGPDADRWTIIVSRAPDADAAAQLTLDELRTTGKLPDARLITRKGQNLFAVGSFGSPEDAQKRFAQVRATTVGPLTPYASAFLAPPERFGVAGSMPQFDLRNASKVYGKNALYTLLINTYGRGDGQRPAPEELAQFRAAAEKAVRELRAAGEPAFYHHGPNSSSVTIGIFGPDDHDPSTRPPLESMPLRAARDRHPNALLNGQGMKVTLRGTDGRPVERLQPSQLVAVPRD